MIDEYKGIGGFFRRRQHPVKILMYIAKYLWLLLIPLAKYLIATQFDFENWVKTNWVDILTLSVIFGYGILRWVFIYFEIEEDGIIAHTGYFGIEKTQVYFSEMSSMSLCQGYIFRLLGACTVYIDTDAKSIGNTDIRLDISQKQAFRIYELATKRCRNKPKYIFNSQKRSLIIFSLLFSSTLSGMLLTLTFIYQAYRIVGREIEEEFLTKVNTQLEKLAVHIPKYLIVAAAVVTGSWLVSFISNLMRHWGFSCTRCADMLLISSGKGTKRRHVIMRDRINFIDYQQSMFMKLFGICSVQVHCTGYGKRRLELSALVPITTNTAAETSVRLLMPNMPTAGYDVRTGWGDVRRFVTVPLLICLLPGALYEFLCRLIPHFEMVVKTIPDWKSAITNLAVISMLPLVWLVIVKVNAAFNTAAGFENGQCMLSYCKFYRFHRAAVRIDRISKIKITRNPFQRMNGTCHLYVYTSAEGSSRHVVKGLNYERLISAMQKAGLLESI
ncbi:PH domain-containing protein [Ruminococcus sp.]|uniref:PH domain-containing protein n=1 Tax=Ruminococcus sp. TaxID=41978 RepID=UPI00258F876D|nr:PH domain-containing protein [Ruminococcus sp.]MCR5022472.1 PH domain-containing protein [Ruminococcus sp.]